MFALVVADRRGLLLAVAADALLGRARDHPLYPRQRPRQALPAGMRALGLGTSARSRLIPLALSLNLRLANTGLLFQQL